MSDEACGVSAEKDRGSPSAHFDERCAWYAAEVCPHPRGCDAKGRCLHPLNNHDEWRELNK